MTQVKDYVRFAYHIEHFLTYADNYAIGYFKKQGTFILFGNYFTLES